MKILNKLYNNAETYYNLKLMSLYNKKIIKKDNCLTWPNYLGKLAYTSYEEYYEFSLNNGQYSFLLVDDSMVQLYYECHNNIIKKANLAYLPSSNNGYTYFRFDLDINSKTNYYHNTYHIHFGFNSNNFRLSLYSFPYPSEFLNFINSLYKNFDKNFSSDKLLKNLDELKEEYNHCFLFKC